MLQAGGPTWHRVAFAEVAAGAASAPLAVSLAIILLNLIL